MQVIPADKIAEMNNIMTHVVTEGTGRAAQIPGLVISGKTGTTNNSTNAWFNGFTGNLVCSVWFGNDDNTGMQKMTGGELPAQSWKQIMAYAHQGLETKPPFGVAAPAPGAVAQISAAPVAKTGAGIVEADAARRPRASLDADHPRDRRTRAKRAQSAGGLGSAHRPLDAGERGPDDRPRRRPRAVMRRRRGEGRAEATPRNNRLASSFVMHVPGLDPGIDPCFQGRHRRIIKKGAAWMPGSDPRDQVRGGHAGWRRNCRIPLFLGAAQRRRQP